MKGHFGLTLVTGDETPQNEKVCHIGKISPNRSSKALGPDQPWPRGAATISINEWFKYFNVRSNLIDLVAGNEYIVKIKPTQHTASPAIQSVSPEKRYCHFEDERGSTSTLSIVLMFTSCSDHASGGQ